MVMCGNQYGEIQGNLLHMPVCLRIPTPFPIRETNILNNKYIREVLGHPTGSASNTFNDHMADTLKKDQTSKPNYFLCSCRTASCPSILNVNLSALPTPKCCVCGHLAVEVSCQQPTRVGWKNSKLAHIAPFWYPGDTL